MKGRYIPLHCQGPTEAIIKDRGMHSYKRGGDEVEDDTTRRIAAHAWPSLSPILQIALSTIVVSSSTLFLTSHYFFYTVQLQIISSAFQQSKY